MGYTTSYIGRFEVEPPLNEHEQRVIEQIVIGPTSPLDHIIDFYLGDHLCWVPVLNGRALEWNGAEKFKRADRWIAFLIRELLSWRRSDEAAAAPELKGFSFDHVVNGSVFAAGEAVEGDLWRIDVEDNIVSVVEYGKHFVPFDLVESWSDDHHDWTCTSDVFFHLAYREPVEALEALRGIVEVAHHGCFAPFREFIEDLDAVAVLPSGMLELARLIPLEPT